jgi:hypothetical protein
LTLLACLLLFQDKLGCSGCCSHHGGIACINGVTRCKDGTPLSSKCTTCNACGSQTPNPKPTPTLPTQPPSFIPQQAFGWDSLGNFVCVLPSPNRDGLCPEGGGYTLTLREKNIIISGMVGLKIESDHWPVVLSLPSTLLPIVFTVAVRRVCGTSQSEEWILTAPKRPSTSQEPATSELDRWLLHVPKRAGGFAAVVRVVNLNTDSALTTDLFAYSETGLVLGKASLTLEAGESRYWNLYEAGGLFLDLTDRVSYIGIRDGSNALRVSLGYKALNSGYTVWHNEDSVLGGSITGAIQLVEANGLDSSAEGVAVLNLTNDHEIQVIVKQISASGECIASKSLGALDPGAKILAVLSSMFQPQQGSRYQLETELGESFQLLGLTFSGSFFSTAETQVVK